MKFRLYRLNEVELIMKQIEMLLIEHNCAKEKKLDLALCIREGLNNGILHGNGGDETKEVLLDINFEQKCCVFTIHDCGDGIEKKERNKEVDGLSESGRGLMLMQELLDQLECGKGYIKGKMDLE